MLTLMLFYFAVNSFPLARQHRKLKNQKALNHRNLNKQTYEKDTAATYDVAIKHLLICDLSYDINMCN